MNHWQRVKVAASVKLRDINLKHEMKHQPPATDRLRRAVTQIRVPYKIKVLKVDYLPENYTKIRGIAPEQNRGRKIFNSSRTD